jgi:hypothetical protein
MSVTSYRITPSGDGISVELTGIGDSQDELLAAFGDCQNGQCSCPTDEYEKLEGMDLESYDDGIAIHLHAKPGQEFDTEEIATCVEYTVHRTSSPPS